MPVATRSQTVCSPRAPDEEEQAGEGVSWHGRTRPGYSLMRMAHCKLKERMKSMEQSREDNAGKQIQGNPPLKSSHPSVDLFSPSMPTERRDSTAGRIFVPKESEDNVQEKIPNPALSPRVLGQCNWNKQGEGKDRDSILERFAYSCRTAQQQQQQPRCFVARRLTIAGAGDRIVGGPNHLETISERGGGIGEGSRIMVYVRLRPMAKKEKEAGSRSCVRIVNKRDVYLTEFAMETDYLRLKRLRGRHFVFDGSFPDNTTQAEVYNATTSELVEGVLQGRNGSVFCYGATGAGKTHTMLGTVQNPGVMVLAIKDLFTKIRQRSCDGDRVVRLSYLEVYNEMVRDLLSPGRPLVLREDKQGIVAAGLTQYQAYSTDEVMALLQQGNHNRTTEPTRINETSSRSHAILQVVAEYKVKEGSNMVTRVGKLSLIDLAGSERALATDQRTVRSLEGANINRSLLALSSCINALVEGKKHIPYRNSKLTQLLKDSLGGACHTVMIANISPSNLSFGETQNTLHWADRAKEIRTKACIAKEEFQPPESQSEQAKLLLEVQKENQQLRMQIARYQQKLLSVQNQSLASSPALSSSSSLLLPPSPLTPAAPATRVPDRHYSKVSQCCTPETVAKRELSFNDTGKAAEEIIQELKTKIRALEMESERIKKESVMKEKKLTSSIMALKREHGVQLRHKEDFIRKLCQKALLSNHAFQKSPSASEHEEILHFSQPSEKNTALKSTIMIPSASARPPSERLVNIVPPEPVGSKIHSPPQNVPNPSLRTGRRAHPPNVAGGLRSPSQSQRLSSPATGKKRTFWDITNANSPSAAQSRSTRSHRAADAPSMLLQLGYPCFWLMFILGPPLVAYLFQPGFARHRPSLN